MVVVEDPVQSASYLALFRPRDLTLDEGASGSGERPRCRTSTKCLKSSDESIAPSPMVKVRKAEGAYAGNLGGRNRVDLDCFMRCLAWKLGTIVCGVGKAMFLHPLRRSPRPRRADNHYSEIVDRTKSSTAQLFSSAAELLRTASR